MKINTKYNIGDCVHYLDEGKAVEGKIEKIGIKIDGNGVKIKYLMEEKREFFRMMRDDYDFIDGERLFSSKEELIASL